MAHGQIGTPRRVDAARVMKQSWRCVCAAALGAVLSGGAVMEQAMPLALAYLCALPFGAEAICVYAGACVGYWLWWPGGEAVEPMAAGFLMLAGLGMFREAMPEEGGWFRSAAACALYAVVSLIFLLQGSVQPFEVTCYILRLVVLAGFTAAFGGKQRNCARRIAVIAGGAKIALPGGMTLGAVIAAGAAGSAVGGAGYLLTAVRCGLTLDLCQMMECSATLLFSAAALAAHAVPLRTGVGRRGVFVGVGVLGTLVAGGMEPGMMLALLLGGAVGAVLPGRERMEAAETEARFEKAGAALHELAMAMEQPGDAPLFVEESPQRAVNAALRRQYQARLGEMRAIVAGQYRAVGRLLQQTKLPEPPLRYRPEVAVAVRGKDGGAGGDRVESFQCGEWFYVLLCDGMGTGAEAAKEAGGAIFRLRQMIEGGFDAQDALQMLNACYILRGSGVFATVDLAQISLVSGEGFLHKWGAAPSYLRSRLGTEKIGTTSPPPGLGVGQTHQPECVRLSLERGQMLVLASDGVSERAVLHQMRAGTALRAIAEGIVSLGGTEEADDRSAAVVRLRAPLPCPKHSTKAARILSKLGRGLNI